MVSDAAPSKNSTIDSEYLLLSILKNKESKACEIVNQLGLNYDQARLMLMKGTGN
jgi:ATP-dependent Clp protease ATP-binding subunit ClpA